MKYRFWFLVIAAVFNAAALGTYYMFTSHYPSIFELLLMGMVLAGPIGWVARSLSDERR